MLEACAQAVERAGISLVQTPLLYTPSTFVAKYLTSQVFLCGRPSTAYKQLSVLFTQAKKGFLSPLYNNLCSLYSGPTSITKNKLIRISI
jgi:hypothetical protein